MRRGEGRSILLDLASAAGLVLAVFFFVYHHPLLAIAALVAIGLAGYKFWNDNSADPVPTPTEQPTEIIVTETVTPEEPTSTTPETIEVTTEEEEPPAPVTVTETHSVISTPTPEITTHQPTPEVATPEETQPQVNDTPTDTPELDSQDNPTEESALQGDQ